MARRPPPPATPEVMGRLLERIMREVARLHSEVHLLNARIEPVEGTPEEMPPLWLNRLRTPATPEEVRDLLINCDRQLIALALDMQAIRARIEAIENNTMLRDDFRPWIKRPPTRP